MTLPVDDSESNEYEQFVLRLIRTGSLVELKGAGLVAEAAVEQIAHDLLPIWASAAVRVAEVRVNGARADVRLESADGRAWLAVLTTDGRRPIELLGATFYERPPIFAGRPSGRVVVVNGPSSVGKSSLMATFADAASAPWACLDEPMFGRLATKFLAWPGTAGPVTDGFLAALAAGARAGNQFIVSAAGIEQDRFRRALVDVPTVYVGLDAPLPVLLERQLSQADKFGGLAEESVDIHDDWAYDLRIDTSSREPSDAARLLAEFLDTVDS
jgi:chloramphenicol 3-O phosphotransferase